MGLEWLLIVLIAALVVGFGLGRYTAGSPDVEAVRAADKTTLDTPEPNAVDLMAIARSLEDPMQDTALPKAVLELADFQRGVELLCDDAYSMKDVLAYLKGENWVISCIAAEALCRRREDEDVTPSVLAHLQYFGAWPMYFVLKYLGIRASAPLIGAVLMQVQEWWLKNRSMVEVMAEFVGERLARGEAPTFADRLADCSEKEIPYVSDFLAALGMEALAPLRREISNWQGSRVDVTGLNAIGRIWTSIDDGSVVEHTKLARNLVEVEKGLLEPPYRSFVLVGDSGVGKTALVRLLAVSLQRRGWTLFEAGAADVLAGQVYIGELEGRIKSLLSSLAPSRRVLWYAPNFHQFLHAGSHRHDPTGVLDRILPAIEARRVVIVGETSPEGYTRIVQARKRVCDAMEAMYIEALPDADTIRLAREWIERKAEGVPYYVLDPDTLAEGFSLVKEYLPDKSAPGNLLQFLRTTCDRVCREAEDQCRISVYDFLATLSQMTGMPQEILDDRRELDTKALQLIFNRRVVGQTEAVNCLVERIAMVKASLHDPSRPLGVFLFVGPTGTGKTEIAKTLSQFLFGSKDRMIRLDMSEFQTPDAIDKILGYPGTAQTANSLADLIRKQPFAVILLDEFEKAHPRVWDLFLQVFDDGRLSDRNGSLADFRRSIIILTSNLGAKISSGTSIGFTQGGTSFSPSAVERAVADTFRPEFINRLDRVVVFHPFSRNVMRRILIKELDDVLLRRGISKREWAVEWDESAVDFLLKKGFTPDLGARPLRRAIERYLLSPLAMTIVQHKVPEGDQFLFITSDADDLRAVFVDPDAPAEDPLGTQAWSVAPNEAPAEIQLKAVALDARGSAHELSLLSGQLEQLGALISAEDWRTAKHEELKKTDLPYFWESSDRFEILSRIEVMDRIESAFRAAASLLRRLSGSRSEREKERSAFSRELLRRLAEQLYLLETAYFDYVGNRPHDAFVFIDTHLDAQTPREAAIAFFQQINSMYISWAKKRRMQYKQLEKTIDAGNQCRGVIAVSGFGAFSILEPETGLHLLETPKDKRAFVRIKVRVRVVPQPKRHAGDDKGWLREAVDRSDKPQEGSPVVVRRYRVEPSPLVRDSARNWRTGRLDRVLAGDFDLIS